MSAYVACTINHDHSRDSLKVMLKMIKMNSEIEFLKHDEIKQNQNLRHEKLLSRRRSNHDDSFIQIFINLSKRFMNKNHDWLQSTCDVTLIIIQDHSIIACVIRKNAFVSATLEKINSFSLLNVEQRNVVDQVIDHYCYRSDAQLLLHLNKIVEIKKLICINLIFSYLMYYAAQINVSNSILWAALINIAVFNIKSFTLHQLLNLLIQSIFKSLKLKSFTHLQNCFRRCCFLIINEKFMIDLKTLHYIDQHSCQIHAQLNVFFENLFILFCDDFDQLSSISDQALYNSHVMFLFMKALINLQTYLAFDQIVVLSQIMRQQDENAESRQFCEILNELQDNKLSSENWNFLLTHVKKNMILRSWIDFNEALHLYIIRHKINEYNFNCLEWLNQSIIKICIKHANKEAKKISFNDADKLSCTLLFSRDAQVMLMFNMFIEKNLINDLMNIVVDVIWNNDTDDSFTTLSAVVLMKMNDYVDSISMLVNNRNVVSIFLRTATWNNNDNTCSHEQFSLILIFAITIHKSQRLILIKVILNLAMLNFYQDLTYVNLSWVHWIQDLAFKISFFYDHFFQHNDESIFKCINDSHC